jgi:hypothetical protein
MEWVLGLVGGLGIGSLVTTIAAHFMARRATASDRWYQEKREAYLGLLNALHDAAVHPSVEHSKNYALWQTRCELFGSETVSTFAQQMVDTNTASAAERQKVFRNLVTAMRADLKN